MKLGLLVATLIMSQNCLAQKKVRSYAQSPRVPLTVSAKNAQTDPIIDYVAAALDKKSFIAMLDSYKDARKNADPHYTTWLSDQAVEYFMHRYARDPEMLAVFTVAAPLRHEKSSSPNDVFFCGPLLNNALISLYFFCIHTAFLMGIDDAGPGIIRQFFSATSVQNRIWCHTAPWANHWKLGMITIKDSCPAFDVHLSISCGLPGAPYITLIESPQDSVTPSIYYFSGIIGATLQALPERTVTIIGQVHTPVAVKTRDGCCVIL